MKNLCVLLCLCSGLTFAQVGIGTTTPNATLEIKSTNEATPSNNDGLLIPKVEEFPVTPPTAAQDGMLVYATGAGSVSKGFYYWDNGTTAWVLATGAKRINDLIDGKSDNDGSNDGSSIFLGIDAGVNDDATGNRNVGIGYHALLLNTAGYSNSAIGFDALSNNTSGRENTAIGSGSLLSNSTGTTNTATGHSALYDNTIGFSNSAYGVSSLNKNIDGYYNSAFGALSLRNNVNGINNVALGYFALYVNISGNGNTGIGTFALENTPGSYNVALGYRAGVSESGSNKLYIENSGANQDGALIYGEFDTNILRTNSTFQIGNPSSSGYAFPNIDGLANQVLQTDGAGAMSWVNPSLTVTHSTNDLVDGKSDNDGTDDGSSIFLGVDAGALDDGTNNQNVGIGYQALQANTTGNLNTANGYRALFSNISGEYNVAIGAFSLYNNTTGNQNTASGYNALVSNTFGIENSAFGNDALLANDQGNGNTAVGNEAMLINLDGNLNTASGSHALHWNLVGDNNAAFGAYSLFDTGGDNNSAVGVSAGRFVSGNNNVFLGYQAGRGASALTKNGSVHIGYQAGYNELNNDRLYIENSNSAAPLIYGEFDNDILGFNAVVGIGNQSPGAPLHVSKEGTSGVQTIVAAIDSNTSNRPVLQFSESSSIDLNAGMSLEYDGRGSGGANRMVFNGVGGNPLFEFRNGGDLTLRDGDLIVRGAATDREIKIEDDAGNPDRVLMRQTGTQDIYVGDIDNNGGDTYVRAGGSTELSVIAGTGFVGINTLAPGYTLEVNGNAAKPGGGSWINSSDRRLKQNINQYTDGLEQLLQIEPVTYHYNSLSGFDQSKQYVGVIAQDLNNVAPYMVQNYQRDGSEFMAVDNSAMTYMLINAVKSQQVEIELLRKEISEIKTLLKSNE